MTSAALDTTSPAAGQTAPPSVLIPEGDTALLALCAKVAVLRQQEATLGGAAAMLAEIAGITPATAKGEEAKRAALAEKPATLDDLIAALAAAEQDHKTKRAAWRPIFEAKEAFEEAVRPTRAAEEAAMAALPIPAILAVPHNSLEYFVMHFADGTSETKSAGGPGPTVRALSYNEIKERFSDDPPKLEAVTRAYTKWQDDRSKAVRRLWPEALRAAEEHASTLAKPMCDAMDREEAAAKALANYKAATPGERWRQIEALLAHDNATFDHRKGLSGFDGETDSGSAVIRLALKACHEQAYGKAAASRRWNAALEKLQQAKALSDAIDGEVEKAEDAVREAAPVPKALGYKNRHILTEAALDDTDLPLSRKAELLVVLRGWQKQRDDAEKARDLPQLRRRQRQLGNACWRAGEQLINTPAPTAEAMVAKMAHWFRWVHGEEIDNPQTISQFVSNQDDDDGLWAQARFFQDALGLAGERSDLLSVQPFDAEAWIASFEALPGHSINERWGFDYKDPEAYGAPAWEELIVTDPEAIARYNAWEREKVGDAAFERMREGQLHRLTRRMQIGQRETIGRMYPDGGAEHDRLLALWDRRAEMRNGPPLGRHLSDALAPWQRTLVKEAAKARAARLDPKSNAHEPWLALVLKLGGAASLVDGQTSVTFPAGGSARLQNDRRWVQRAIMESRYLIHDIEDHLRATAKAANHETAAHQ